VGVEGGGPEPEGRQEKKMVTCMVPKAVVTTGGRARETHINWIHKQYGVLSHIFSVNEVTNSVIYN
jgi:hypothetical protein